MTTSGMVTLCCDNHHQILVEGIWNFLQSEHCVDLNIGVRSIPGHRLILDVFLSSDKLLETANHRIGHPDCVDDDLDSLLKFLYRGKVVVPETNMANLMLMAKNSNFTLLVEALELASKNVTSETSHHDQTECPGTLDSVCTPSVVSNSQLQQMTVNTKFDEITEIGLDSDDRSDARIAWQPSSDTPESQSEVDTTASPNTKFKQHSSKMKQRQSTPESLPPHKCGQCDVIAASAHLLELHTKRAHGQSEKHKCLICGKEYGELRSLRQHTRRHEIESGALPEKEKPYNCQVCQKAFSCNFLLTCHQRSHTGERPFICHQCGKAYSTASVLRKHLISHENRFQCQVCQRRFGSAQQLEYHLRTHSGEKPFICDQCGKSFAKKFNMSQHRLTHDEDSIKKKLVRCHVCQKELSDKHSLAEHIRYIHGCEQRPKQKRPPPPPDVDGNVASTYKCSPCEKKFNTYGAYALHMLKHRVGKRYTCNDCQKAFFMKSELEVHQLVHTGAKPFKCEVETCQRAFGTLSHLTRHRRTHTGEKQFQCDVCLRTFVNGSNLKIHKLTVHGSDRGAFNCNACNLSFARLNKLRKHEMTHTNIDVNESLELNPANPLAI